MGFGLPTTHAQESAADSTLLNVVQISGMVVTGDSLSPLSFATVYRMRDSRGTMTDANGFFSIPALEGDTLRVSSMGYIAQQFTVPSDLQPPRMNVVQPLGRDT
ncbi:MAG: carboxypeptidase-like regulatory domain-containing protein, partial [Flavobacteriales bacterium]|nr:carboxypeptidase-like regulatory domain-containing protein [Flavobacteriales bacterium]